MDSVQFGGFKQNKTKKYKLKLSKFVEAFKLITYTLHIYIYIERYLKSAYILFMLLLHQQRCGNKLYRCRHFKNVHLLQTSLLD